MENRMKNEQEETPYLDALKKYVSENVSPFDVPGHHMGNVPNDFKDFVGDMTYKCDVNAPRGLDNLNHPHGMERTHIKGIENTLKLIYLYLTK